MVEKINIKIQKKNGYWCLVTDDGGVIRSPYAAEKDKSDVVAYAKRAFPDAHIMLEAPRAAT